MNKLRGIRLRITVLATYAFMMMVMGFLHQPVAGVSAAASASQIATGDIPAGHQRHAAAGEKTLTAADHAAMGHAIPQGDNGDTNPHKNHNRVICDACLANAGHAALPTAPALEKLVALAIGARVVLSSLVLEEAGTRIAQPRAPPVSLIA